MAPVGTFRLFTNSYSMSAFSGRHALRPLPRFGTRGLTLLPVPPGTPDNFENWCIGVHPVPAPIFLSLVARFFISILHYAKNNRGQTTIKFGLVGFKNNRGLSPIPVVCPLFPNQNCPVRRYAWLNVCAKIIVIFCRAVPLDILLPV